MTFSDRTQPRQYQTEQSEGIASGSPAGDTCLGARPEHEKDEMHILARLRPEEIVEGDSIGQKAAQRQLPLPDLFNAIKSLTRQGRVPMAYHISSRFIENAPDLAPQEKMFALAIKAVLSAAAGETRGAYSTLTSLNLGGLEAEMPEGMEFLTGAGRRIELPRGLSVEEALPAGINSPAELLHAIALDEGFGLKVRQAALNISCFYYATKSADRIPNLALIPEGLMRLAESDGFTLPHFMRS